MTGFQGSYKSPGQPLAPSAPGQPAEPAATGPAGAALPGRPAYRADIDGLRAVAVGGVIAFHFGLGPSGGGFIGVDVFFVISGFLIAGILRRTRQETGVLSGFLERRLRRIAPALLVTLAACSLAATRLLPNDLQAIGLGIVNAVAFNANGYFATLADDYFAAGTLAVDPVLHIWSLAVEAQFYLVFALLWTVRRGRRAIILPVLTLASFLAGLAGAGLWPAASFYLLPTRFWEFMAGAALTLPTFRVPGRGLAALLAAAGLALIAAGFVAFTAATPFPGLAAVLPCLGAALVIHGGSRANPVSRALGGAPLALIGRHAYALYLWHWPVLVFSTYGRASPLPGSARAGLLVLTGLLAWLTTRFVERPLIARRWLAAPRPFLLACIAAGLAVAGAGLALNLAGQNVLVLTRLPPEVMRLAAGRYDTVDLRCPVGPGAEPGCRFGMPEAEPTVALWGNSFARMWLPALDAAARRRGVGGVALLVVRCPPLLGTAFPTLRGCADFNRAALAFLDANPRLTTVVLGGDWSAWATEGGGLARTIEALRARGRHVAIILSPPAVPYAVPRTLALAALQNRSPPPLVTESEARAARGDERAMAGAVGAEQRIVVVDPFDAFCDNPGCAVAAEGRTLYYDDRHVTRFGATRAAALFDLVFQKK